MDENRGIDNVRLSLGEHVLTAEEVRSVSDQATGIRTMLAALSRLEADDG